MSVQQSASRQSAAQQSAVRAARREYGLALLAGAVGAGLIILAVRQQWAQAVFTPQKPLTTQVVDVSGSDLAPLAGALALAALAGLAAVIATRGVLRRVAGVVLALFGAGAGAAIMTSVTAATVLSVAASKVASPESAALSGTAGSTTSGSTGSGALVLTGTAGHAIMTGTPWHVAILAGALLVFLAGLATVLRGPDWPVMSARYDAPAGRGTAGGRRAPGTPGAGGTQPGAAGSAGSAGRAGGPGRPRPLDAATMWESLNGGEDPTDDGSADDGWADGLPDDGPADAGTADEAPAPATRPAY